METLGLFLFGQREIKIQRPREREGGYTAAERGRGRARGKFVLVLGALAFVVLLTSVLAPRCLCNLPWAERQDPL